VVLAGAVGKCVIARMHPVLYAELVNVHGKLFMNHKFVGFCVAIAVGNGILAMSIVSEHSQIWYAFGSPSREACESDD
jgi:hypothetical protein